MLESITTFCASCYQFASNVWVIGQSGYFTPSDLLYTHVMTCSAKWFPHHIVTRPDFLHTLLQFVSIGMTWIVRKLHLKFAEESLNIFDFIIFVITRRIIRFHLFYVLSIVWMSRRCLNCGELSVSIEQYRIVIKSDISYPDCYTIGIKSWQIVQTEP